MNGPPILVLPAFGNPPWGGFVDALGRTMHVIPGELRGRSTRAMAEDAMRRLDALGILRTHVFGLSLGGMVAMWLAALAPERVIRLVLGSTLPRPRSASARVLRALPLLRRTRRFRLHEVLAVATHRLPPLEKIRMPALVICGEDDPVARERARSELLLGLPHAELALLPGAGHDLAWDSPELLAERIVEFTSRGAP